jgi:TPR repeat protein
MVPQAAEQGLAEAQYNLGSCYAKGDGVAKDNVEAYKWLSLARSQGNEVARTDLNSLAKQMTPEQTDNQGFPLGQ